MFLYVVVFLFLWNSSVTLATLKNESHSKSNFCKMSDSRFIVDDVISTAELGSLQEVIDNEPLLTVEKPTFCIDCAERSKQAILPTVHFLQNISAYGITSHRETEMKKHVKDIESTVLSYCESFFNVKVTYHYSALVSRARIDLEDSFDFSPPSINNRSGWVVKVHADVCAFDKKTWLCPPPANPYAAQFAYNHVTAVILLNELAPNAGGNLVFIDPLHRESLRRGKSTASSGMKSGGSSTSNGRRHALSKEESSSSSSSIYSNYLQSYGSQKSSSVTNSSQNVSSRHHTIISRNTKSAADTYRFVRKLTVRQWEDDMPPVNYTVIRSRARRMIMWNSSIDNVHGVTQILEQGDHRYTFFMFMQIEKH